MVEVVFEEVVLREIHEVRLLHIGKVGRSKRPDVHLEVGEVICAVGIRSCG